MTTRAGNIQFLLSGVSSTTTGEPVAAGTVYFYEAGTTTQKYVWTEIEKTNGYYSYALDGVGAAQLYGEGNYKVVIKDSGGATVATLDDIRIEYPYYGIRSVTSSPVTQLSQDDFLLVNTTSEAITINCLAAASWTRPLKIMRIAGSNNITISPNGSETIDYATISSNAVVEIISDGSNLRTAGIRSSFIDADGDTQIQVEESADEDVIRFDAGGTQDVLRVYGSGPYMVYTSGGVAIDTGDLYISAGNIRVTNGDIQIDYDKVFIGGGLTDTDGDTKIQVEESADEDVIRFDAGGTQDVMRIYGSGPHTIYMSGGLEILSGGLDITDTSGTNPVNTLVPNVGDSTAIEVFLGKEKSTRNSGFTRFYHNLDGNTGNFFGFGIYGSGTTLLVDGSNKVTIGTGAISTGAQLQVNGEIESTSLDINGNADVSGTLDIGASTTRRLAPAGTFANNANDNPNISDTILTVSTAITISTWESVGPTDSEADNIWTALDSVPDDADWIAVRILGGFFDGTANSNLYATVNARATGGSQTAASDNEVYGEADRSDASGEAYAKSTVFAIIPVDTSIRFDARWYSGFTTTTIEMCLVGWGFNP